MMMAACKPYNKLKCDISKSITIAKKDYSAKIQQQHMKSFYQAYLQYLVTQCIFKQAFYLIYLFSFLAAP